MTQQLENILADLLLAKQTIDGWEKDAEGRVHVHTDVISKAVNAAIATVRGAREVPRG